MLSPHQDSNPGPQHERLTTYQLSYPYPHRYGNYYTGIPSHMMELIELSQLQQYRDANYGATMGVAGITNDRFLHGNNTKKRIVNRNSRVG